MTRSRLLESVRTQQFFLRSWIAIVVIPTLVSLVVFYFDPTWIIVINLIFQLLRIIFLHIEIVRRLDSLLKLVEAGSLRFEGGRWATQTSGLPSEFYRDV